MAVNEVLLNLKYRNKALELQVEMSDYDLMTLVSGTIDEITARRNLQSDYF